MQTDWLARPVLHVKHVATSLCFYVERLGFTCPWRYDEDGVAQVDRQGCALILADTWPEKIGKGLMFISLNVEPHSREAAIAAVDALRAELEAKGVPVKEGSWGYRLLVVDDPDGNQLFFNYPAETAEVPRAGGAPGAPMKEKKRYTIRHHTDSEGRDCYAIHYKRDALPWQRRV